MARIGYDYCHEKKTSGYNLSGNIQMGHGQKKIFWGRNGPKREDLSAMTATSVRASEKTKKYYIYINIGHDIGCFMMFPKMAVPPNHPF